MNITSLPTDDLCAMTKSELYQEFRKFGRDVVRLEMNTVIAKVRGVPLKEAKVQKVLKGGEVAELRKRFA
ncbi:hypothetical protein FLJC2902T_17410 [Flavobacterium limnosediminis JC2902]|uniref:Uncharacterized protein n=2 Tax=Flavobacterium TaxID=237 RepID=V6SQ97_9FLAO|nr:hypothetical protein FLJC2902T_17410 [Flavobacterium limnosediminis JC2902]